MWPFRHALWSAPRHCSQSLAGPTANLSWRSGKPFWQSTLLLENLPWGDPARTPARPRWLPARAASYRRVGSACTARRVSPLSWAVAAPTQAQRGVRRERVWRPPRPRSVRLAGHSDGSSGLSSSPQTPPPPLRACVRGTTRSLPALCWRWNTCLPHAVPAAPQPYTSLSTRPGHHDEHPSRHSPPFPSWRKCVILAIRHSGSQPSGGSPHDLR